MIYLLHGDDTHASYLRLQSLIANSSFSQKVVISKDNVQLLNQELFSHDLFQTPKILICENLISSKKISSTDLKKVSYAQIIILWENQQISPASQKAFDEIAKIENFKLPQTIFYFLDALSPNPKRAIYHLSKFASETKSLNWHLQNRLFLLILAKLNLQEASTSQISGKNLAVWQRQKITAQASAFSLEKLKAMFTAALKIETLIKTGVTSIPETTLISLMLSKYLAYR